MPRAALLATLVVMAACDSDGPPLAAADVRAFAPMPGSETAVAYLDIENRSGSTITLDTFRSPDFERVELHETEIRDDTVRMRQVEHLEVPARGRVTLAENGLHLMLLGPRGTATVGQRVTLHLGHDGSPLLVIETDLLGRYGGSER